jgi:hypothetical protein
VKQSHQWRLFLSEQPFSLNDEIVRWWKNSSWNLREKEENYYQFAHEVDSDYNDMFKFATEICLAALHETSKKNPDTYSKNEI